MKSKILISTIFLFSVVYLSAQETQKDSVVNRSVTVEREFQPIIQDAGKVITAPKEIELQVEKNTPVYADFTTPLQVNYSIKALDPEQLIHHQNPTKSGFFRFGIGYPFNTLGDFMYPLVKNKTNRLDFSLHHLGAFGTKTHSLSVANLHYDHIFENMSVFAGINGSHDYFNYYGKWNGIEKPFIMSAVASSTAYDSKTVMYNTPQNTAVSLYDLSGMPQNETHFRVNSHVGLKSLPQSDGIKYLVDLQYNIFQSTKERMNENQLLLKGMFEVPFNYDLLGMNVDINNVTYSVHNNTSFSFPKTYSVIKFNPYYKISGEVGFVKLGGKIGISPNHGQLFTPTPDIEMQWNAIKEYVAIYTGITGDLKINTMSSIYNENRYLSSPTRLNDLYTPVDLFAGIKFKPAYNFLLDVFGNYKVITNQYFFVNREYENDNAPESNLTKIYQNRFDVIYANATQRSAGLRANYNYKKLVNVYLKGAYHYWDVKDQQYAWQMPSWDVDFGTNVQIMRDLHVNAQVFFQDGRYAKMGNNAVAMTPTLDINLGGSYSYNNWMSFFVKLNNLLNRHYDLYYSYEVQGINAMAGVTLSF